MASRDPAWSSDEHEPAQPPLLPGTGVENVKGLENVDQHAHRSPSDADQRGDEGEESSTAGSGDGSIESLEDVDQRTKRSPRHADQRGEEAEESSTSVDAAFENLSLEAKADRGIDNPDGADPCKESFSKDDERCKEAEGSKNRSVEKCASIGGLWNSLPPEVIALILAHCPFNDLFGIALVCKCFRDVMKWKTFQRERGRLFPVECSWSPLIFYVAGDKWHMLGHEHDRKMWRKLPPFRKPIPLPAKDLFKDFLVSGHGGLFCVNVGKSTESEKILVSNPVTGEVTIIPPLKFPRPPVALNLYVTSTKNFDTISSSYRILAVGSATTGTEELSRKTEFYDSRKGEWEVVGDVPGSEFAVNEHQSGVYCAKENVVLIVGFLVNGSKGVLAFDVERREWREHWLCPFLQLPNDENAGPVHFAIAQLVECSGVIYLFSEQEVGRVVTHCIDRLDLLSDGEFAWTRKVTRQRHGYRALLVYPEYTCVPVRENKLCIFNSIERSGVVYNMLADPIDSAIYESIPTPPPLDDGIIFHSLNPVTYAYEPSFGVSV